MKKCKLTKLMILKKMCWLMKFHLRVHRDLSQIFLRTNTLKFRKIWLWFELLKIHSINLARIKKILFAKFNAKLLFFLYRQICIQYSIYQAWLKLAWHSTFTYKLEYFRFRVAKGSSSYDFFTNKAGYTAIQSRTVGQDQ